jgi:hypothetical protein
MHMNLQNVQSLIFVNASNNKLSMIYQRNDNNIAWVDTNLDMSNYLKEIN